MLGSWKRTDNCTIVYLAYRKHQKNIFPSNYIFLFQLLLTILFCHFYLVLIFILHERFLKRFDSLITLWVKQSRLCQLIGVFTSRTRWNPNENSQHIYKIKTNTKVDEPYEWVENSVLLDFTLKMHTNRYI